MTRTGDGRGAVLQDVGIDHGGFYIVVTERFLDGADIGAGGEQMGGVGVAEGVCVHVLGYIGFSTGLAYGVLQHGIEDVVALFAARTRIDRQLARRENVLPVEFFVLHGGIVARGV